MGWPFGPVVQLLILTAARRDEIGALQWSEIKADRIILEGARTKNAEPREIPLSDTARRMIASLPHIGESEFVFTTTGNGPIGGWSKAKTQLDAMAAQIIGRPPPAWRFHDLRRTAATGLQRLGIDLQVTEAILGHIAGSRAGVVGIYQRHSFNSEKRTALETWARHVEALVGEGSSNVLPLRRA